MLKFAQISKVKPGQFDQVIAPVRSLRSPHLWMEQVPVLAPSPDLFHKYLDLRKEGYWNRESFREIYVPQFLRELKANPKAAQWLNRLYLMDKRGKNIALTCYCTDETVTAVSSLGCWPEPAVLAGLKSTNRKSDISTYTKSSARAQRARGTSLGSFSMLLTTQNSVCI